MTATALLADQAASLGSAVVLRRPMLGETPHS